MKRHWWIAVGAVLCGAALPGAAPMQRRSRSEALIQSVMRSDTQYTVQLLKQGVDANTTEMDGWATARHRNGTPVLYWAVTENDIEGVQALLAHGADPSRQDSIGATPLAAAAIDGHERIVRLLLEHGANPNQHIRGGATPLIFAAARGHARIIELLLQHGARVNESGSHGTSPLMVAARTGSPSSVRVLLHYGADPQQRDVNGYVALDWAIRRGNEVVAQILREAGTPD